jgi:hypothetical protein
MITRLLCDADDRSNKVRYRGIDKTRFIAGHRQEHLNVSEIDFKSFQLARQNTHSCALFVHDFGGLDV